MLSSNLHMITILGTIWFVYQVFLRRKPNVLFNRLFILSGIFISLMVFLPQVTMGETNLTVYQFPTIQVSQEIITPAIQIKPYLFWFWLIPTLFLLSVFLFRLLKLAQFLNKSSKETHENTSIYVLSQEDTAFSFFSFIFISRNLLEEKSASSIIMHEKAHSKKLHSLDIVIAECMKILFWFNPFTWLIKRSLCEIHEFEADRSVVKKGISITEYQNLLMNYSLQTMNAYTSGFSKILIKRRLINLNHLKIKERKNIMRYIISTSILFLLLQVAIQPLVFAVNENQQTSQYQEVETPPKYKAGEQAMMKQLASHIKYPKEAQKAGIEGKVFIKFTITKEGKMINAEVLKGVNEAMDAEALRVVKTLKDWIPAQKDGKNVAAEMTIPIRFKLK